MYTCIKIIVQICAVSNSCTPVQHLNYIRLVLLTDPIMNDYKEKKKNYGIEQIVYIAREEKTKKF